MRKRLAFIVGAFSIAVFFIVLAGCPGFNPLNNPPVAKAGLDQTVEVGVQVALDGSNSTDPDNNALSYSWEFSTTPPASGMSTSKITGATSVIAYFTPDVAGTYIVQLTVNDGYATATDSVKITASESVTNPPSAPVITAVEADSQVTVSWNDVSGADSYNLYYRKASTVTKSNGTKITGVTSPTVVSGLTNNSLYAFMVIAVNSAGESAPSNTATATPKQASSPPAQPAIAQATAGDGQVTLTWNAITGATKFNIYYKAGNTAGKTDTKLADVTSPYIVTGLTNGTQYAFILTAENTAGESVASDVVTATPQAPPPPPVPSNLHATAVTESTITLSWNTVTEASGYRMYRSLSAGGTFSKVGSDVSSPSTSFYDTGLAANTPYYYKVSAFNATGQESAQSTAVFVTTSPSATQKPQTPGNLHVTAVTESSVSLAWGGVALASEYRVYRSPTSGGTYTKVGTVDDPTDTEFIDTGLTASTAYYYTVTAYNSAGESDPSTPPVQATTSAPAQQIPAVPTGLRVTKATDTSVDLAWDSMANASGYRMYRSGTSGGQYNQVGTDIFGATSFTDYSVAPSTTYYYKVLAFNAAGASAQSTPAVPATTTAPPLQPPATPANLHSTTVTDTSVNMTWNAVANAIGYRLYRSGNSAGPFLQAGPDLAGISYPDTSVTASTTYYYEVSAFNSAGESALSTPAWSVTTAAPLLQPPATPTNFHFGTVTDKSVNLLWDSMTNASGYRVYRSSTSGGQYNQVGTDITGGTSYQDSNLAPQTTYYYKVSAFNSQGESAMSTPPVQVTTAAPALQPPLAPANLHTTSVTATQVNLAWDPATNASGYRLYRSGSSGGPFSQIGADQTVTNYQDGSVTASTTYYYEVLAFNSAGLSAMSTPALPVTTPAPPLLPPATAPTNLRVTAKTLSSVSLAWDTVTGAAWYQLYRDGTLVYSNSVNSYTDQGLASGTTYQYAVEAWNNAGGGPGSANVPGTTQTAASNHDPVVSGSPNPSNGAVNVVLNVTVSWVFTDPDSDTMNYRFYYRPESQGSFNGPYYTYTTASYPLGLALGVKYFWYAEADDGRGGVGTTPIYSFTARGNSAPQVYNPNPPDGATNVVVNLTLGWGGADADLDNVTYQVFVSTNLGQIDQASNKISEGTNKTAAIPYQLAYGTLYYWKVVATDPFQASSYGLWQFTTQPPQGSATLSLDPISVSMLISSLQPAPGYVVVTATAKKADQSVDTLTVVDTTDGTVAHGDIHGLWIWVYSGSQKGTAVLTVHSSSGVTAEISVTVYDSIIQIIAQ